ncbi:MAG: FAD-binding oxidoreductase [Deltaproteobacteria bacterium]|nr:FAD-binding oxidoreductase [Deltaproteobacteria bacterium]
MIEHFKKLLGADSVLTESSELQFYGKDHSKEFTANPSCILLPKDEQQIKEILSYCNENKISIVPSGGRTGYSGAAYATDKEVVLSLEKLNKIIEVNKIDRTITCQAGVVTEKIQQAALENGFYYPVDLAPKGSSHIGGNIATNAGGVRVIRYGSTHSWILGLKVILADGTTLNLNGSLYKNQTGYDLRSLFIGSEGTLGIVVEATMKLTTPPKNPAVILFGCSSLQHIVELYAAFRETPFTISAFECFTDRCLKLVLKHTDLSNPFSETYPAYGLVEIESISEQEQIVDDFFQKLLSDEIIRDAVVSQNSKQYKDFWAYRERISETLAAHEVPHKNDVAVPISAIPNFVASLDQLLAKEYSNFETIVFGHIGDGNLHVNTLKPGQMKIDDFLTLAKELDTELFQLVQSFQGSISAEHGIGLLKKAQLHYSRTNEEIELMRKIKKVFDPNGILNPGKIFDIK